ncbi:hypothetical protein [Shumkonia mesophila]|uniref:hypothetical protein n=1 Tax=Shumkonia mesophila TaxID=2838854 RepID=UPI00293429AE|nr:hypothetical protein [Shumkonia mesophila]
MMKEAKRIHEGQMDYDFVPVYQNSNSVTRAVLKAGRIEASKALPPAITKYGLPGFDNDLSAPYDRIDEMSGMGGRDGRSSPGGGAQKGYSSGRKAGISGLPPSRQEGIKEAGLPVGDPRRRIRAPGAPHEEAMAKPVAAWTEDDARAVMAARIGKPVSEAERQAMAAREREFFRRLYGDGPAPYDATGRLMSAASLRPAKSADAERPLVRLLGLR